MIIVLDTNFLIYIVKQRIADQLKELRAELVVPNTVIKELQKPSLGIKERAFASAALELIKVWNVRVIDSDIRDVDKSIIDIASNLKAHDEKVYVASLDRKLAEALLTKKVGQVGIKRGKIIAEY